jgi:hypothetical protein
MKIVFLLFLLFSCAPILEKEKLEPSKFYKRDMIISINGETEEGVIVAKNNSKYSFHVEARGDLDVFIMNSCHKEETKERAWNVKKRVRSGLFGWGSKMIDVKREVSFDFYPNELEQDDCPLELIGLEKNGKHSWGFVDFENPSYSLKAKMFCNGRIYDLNGVGVCQSRAGLMQKIVFPEKVVVSEKNLCGFKNLDSLSIEFKTPKDKCAVIFKGESGNLFKLTILGYEGILTRGD